MEIECIIFSLMGDYSKIAEELEKELPNQEENKSTPLEKIPRSQLQNMYLERVDENNKLRNEVISLATKYNKLLSDSVTEIRSLKKELDEIYRKYASMSAEFGEMNHFVQEAARIAKKE